jgi:hypothetical protein
MRLDRLMMILTLLFGITSVPLWAQQEGATMVGYTYHQVSGNRYLTDGGGTFPNVQMREVTLDAPASWVVGGVVGESLVWVVVLEDGRVQVVTPMDDAMGVSGMAIEIAQVNPAQPIAVSFPEAGLPSVLTAGDDLSPFTHPIVVNATDGTLAYPARNGDLVLWRDNTELDRAALNLQPDARLVLNADGLLATYIESTDARYVHGIMGDDFEAAGLAVFDVSGGTLDEVVRVMLPETDVYEGISPLWGDVDGDGMEEIVTTVSNQNQGAWLQVYSLTGNIIMAQSNPIGQGFRWRHQLAVGALGINGEPQVVDVLTPHIGGMVEYFDVRGELLSVNNAQLGYTSHVINSRNLDRAVVGDFDGDSARELVLTNQRGNQIIAVRNTERGVIEQWQLDALPDPILTNLSGVVLPDGDMALAAATRQTLYTWRTRPTE